MQTQQRQFKLTAPQLAGEHPHALRFRIEALNGNGVQRRPISREKLLCDELKRQSRAVMQDITECPPPSLPAHLARLRDLRETIDLATRHEFLPADEVELSGKQLAFASTLGDLRACLELTRKSHRAPVFLNDRDEQFQKIWHGIELIAGMVSQNSGVPVPEFFNNNEGENER
jgi:hypothetical protein